MAEPEKGVEGMALYLSDDPDAPSDLEPNLSPTSLRKLPRRLRRRLLESSRSPPTAVEDIEAKLRQADLRRQQFYKSVSSKARATELYSLLITQEEDLGKGVEDQLDAAKHNRFKKQLVRLRGRVFSLAKSYKTLEINKRSVKLMPFELLADQIESVKTLRTLKSLLDQFESCITLQREALGISKPSFFENIDHLLKHTSSQHQRVKVNGSRNSGVKKVESCGEVHSLVKLSRYPVKIVLCAYMIVGHPSAVFSAKDEYEIALAKAAESFIQEFELLIKVILDDPIRSITEEGKFRDPASLTLLSSISHDSQLVAFDKAWCSYLQNFVLWKLKDAKLLEEDLVEAACQLELSMLKTCKSTAENNVFVTNGVEAIKKQVSVDQKLLKEKMQLLSGSAGVERMERTLAGARSKFLEATKAAQIASQSSDAFFQSSSGASDLSVTHDSDEITSLTRCSDTSVSLIQSLPKADDSLAINEFNSSTLSISPEDDRSSVSLLGTDNEALVNEIVHQQCRSFADGLVMKYEDKDNIKVKVREVMEKAFWDGLTETMEEGQPDNSWVIKLIEEVQNELCQLSPSSWRQDIVTTINVDTFSQVLKSGLMGMHYFEKMLEFALVTLQRLSAPDQVGEMKSAHCRLLKELEEISQHGDASNASFALIMMKGLRFVLQEIQVLKQDISKSRIRFVEPLIKGPAGYEYLRKTFTSKYGSHTRALASLPSTVQWISSVRFGSQQEWDEYIDTLSELIPSDQVLSPAILRTGGSIRVPSKMSAATSTEGLEEPECKGEQVDLLLRIGLLKLVIEVEGLTAETVPETFRLNTHRLREVQSQLQKIIVMSTSILVLRQTLVGEKIASTPIAMDNIIRQSTKQLSNLLDSTADVGIQEIVETLDGLQEGDDPKLVQARKIVMANTLAKSLRAGDAVYTRVSRSVYLAARGVVLGGTAAVKGRQLAEIALKRVAAAPLTERLVESVKVLITVATVSARVHGPWYEEVLKQS